MNGNILIAEDDKNIREGLVDTLEMEGYNVTAAKDGVEALEFFSERDFDLVLIDIMMPKKNGYDVCMEIRRKNLAVPVLILTAKGEEIDKVAGLNLGADDYITKPFGIHELMARIRAALRRSEICTGGRENDQENDIFRFGDYEVDPKRFVLIKNNEKKDITKKELDILKLLSSRKGEVVKRDEILNRVWGMKYYGTTRTLDQHIAMLRKKIEKDPSSPIYIKTVHGLGYRYDITDF
ncbi:MAG: response regulator transcription factor [Desulforegulaceae bacterium]|nr:response regulator transcription factor [Desulforegulaceae bacterium]